MDDRTRPDRETRRAEAEEAGGAHQADREPTEEEERRAEDQTIDDDVRAQEREMLERGAHQQGEGRVP